MPRLRLFRSSRTEPPFKPPCSWSDSHDVADARRVQLLMKHGSGTIWVAEVDIDPRRLLDAREDADRIWAVLNAQPKGVRLRDAVHENTRLLRERGFIWVVFTEHDQPGTEYVYLNGDPIDAKRIDRS